MIDSDIIEVLRRKFTRLESELDERGRRRWATSEALELGHGGIKAVAQTTGVGERTIHRGCQELRHDPALASPASRRIRRAGGGRKPLQVHTPTRVSALEALVDPTTRGDPMSPLRGTCKSTRKLARALAGQGHQVSHSTVAQLLADLDYGLQGTRKTLEGASHPDRDAQFRYINRCVKVFQRAGQPVISVDAKKKELVGQFAKGGRNISPKGSRNASRHMIFRTRSWGRFVPMGGTILGRPKTARKARCSYPECGPRHEVPVPISVPIRFGGACPSELHYPGQPDSTCVQHPDHRP